MIITKLIVLKCSTIECSDVQTYDFFTVLIDVISIKCNTWYLQNKMHLTLKGSRYTHTVCSFNTTYIP